MAPELFLIYMDDIYGWNQGKRRKPSLSFPGKGFRAGKKGESGKGPSDYRSEQQKILGQAGKVKESFQAQDSNKKSPM